MFPGTTVTVFLLFAALVEGLENYEKFAEGSCATHPANSEVEHVNSEAFEQMVYIVAGSKYHILRQVSPYPNYAKITEEMLLKCGCPTLNHSFTDNVIRSTFNAFGTPLTTFEGVLPSPGSEGFIETKPLNNFPPSEISRNQVVYTDNANFAVFSNCWTKSDQAAWSVYSRTRTLTELDKKIVLLVVDQLLNLNVDNALLFQGEYCGLCQPQHPNNNYPEYSHGYSEYYK